MSVKHKKTDRKKQEQDWERVAKIFEGKRGLSVMKASRAVSTIERRKLLGSGKTKLVSVRIPEEDLLALRAIAHEHQRKYQQLLVHAIERFLDDYWLLHQNLKKQSK